MTCAMIRLLCALACLLAVAACKERRARKPEDETFASLSPLFAARCQGCHRDDAPRGDFSVERYLSVIACNAEGRIFVEPRDARAPLVAVLERDDHAALLSAAERERMLAWVEQGAPAFIGTVHPSGALDPRSSAWHGRLASTDGFAPLHDAGHALTCGRCHPGAPATPEDVATFAPEAASCRKCHDSPKGVLACGTCHGDDDRPYPPRDACFFGGPARDAHPAHVRAGPALAEPLACSGCHPVPGDALFSGDHADGVVDLRFTHTAAGRDASFDAETKRCAVACHAQGGARPAPAWNERTPLDCQSCHRSPREGHYPGACGLCHAEMDEAPESLTPGPLHLNGVVDVGRGEGGCGACHGAGASGAPGDSGHALHLDSRLFAPIGCDDCHAPHPDLHAPGHLDGEVQVVFGERARARGQSPTWLEDGRCADVACHGAGLALASLSPRFEDAPARDDCMGCHGVPPQAPHVDRETCNGSLCHGSEVGLSATGALDIVERARHVHGNGVIEAAESAPR